MIALYKRATPAQHRVLRAVEGAAHNAAHAYGIRLTDSFARSIAKRAAGTISAQMPELLAGALPPSEKAESVTSELVRPRRDDGRHRSERGPVNAISRASLRKLWKALSARITPLRIAGNNELADAYVEIMKAIAAAQRIGK